MTPSRAFSAVFLAMTACLLLGTAVPAKAATSSEPVLAPHRALYDINLVARKSGSDVQDVSGHMFFEWKQGCDAWTTQHRFKLNYTYSDGNPMAVGSDFSTYEPFGGQEFSYNSRRFRNGEMNEELSGTATMPDVGAGKADYSLPDDLYFELPTGTLFPMRHTLDVIRHAEAGEKFFNAIVFDGSDDEGPVEINTFIGKKVSGLEAYRAGKNVDRKLMNVPAWRIRMAFFPLNVPDADSEYEMDAIVQENGVISDMKVEYKDFTVTQTLSSLQKLPVPVCKTLKTAR